MQNKEKMSKREAFFSGLVIALLGYYAIVEGPKMIHELDRESRERREMCGEDMSGCVVEEYLVPHIDGRITMGSRYVTPTPQATP